jgi:moderate conductance mechanosensitive channel
MYTLCARVTLLLSLILSFTISASAQEPPPEEKVAPPSPALEPSKKQKKNETVQESPTSHQETPKKREEPKEAFADPTQEELGDLFERIEPILNRDEWNALQTLNTQVQQISSATPTLESYWEIFLNILKERERWGTYVAPLELDHSIDELKSYIQSLNEAIEHRTQRHEQSSLSLLAPVTLTFMRLLALERQRLELLTLKQGHVSAHLKESADQKLKREDTGSREGRATGTALPSEVDRGPSPDPSAPSGSPSQESDDMKPKVEPNQDELRDSLNALSALTVYMSSQIKRLDQKRKRVDVLIEEVRQEEDLFESQLESLRSRRADRLDQLERRLARLEIKQEYKETSVETLIGLKATRSPEVHQNWEEMAGLKKELIKQQTAFDQEFRIPISKLTPPLLPPPPQTNEEFFKKYKQVKHAHDIAQRFLTFHQKRLNLMIKALAAAETYTKQIDDYMERLLGVSRVSLEVDVIEELVSTRTFTSPPTVSVIIQRVQERSAFEQLQRFKEDQEGWTEGLDALQAESENWTSLKEEDERAIQRISEEIEGEGGLKKRLELEETWVVFLKEIESFDGPQLIRAHQDALNAFETQSNKIEVLNQKYEDLSKEVNAIIEKLDRLSDPLIRQYPSTQDGFLKWSKPLLDRVNSTSPPPSEEERDDEDQAANKFLPKESYVTLLNLPQEVEPLTKTLRDQIPPRLDYYNERENLRARKNALIKERGQVIETLNGEYTSRVDLTRQVWRSATLISRRVYQKKLPEHRLTKEIKRHRSHDWVRQQKAVSISSLVQDHSEQVNWLSLDPSFKGLQNPLLSWSLILGDILDHIDQLNKFQADNTNQEENLSKLEKDQRAHDLQLRIAQDKNWYENVWEYFHSEDTKALDDFLKGLYQELIRLEHAQDNLNEQLKLTDKIFNSVDKQRVILEKFQTQLKKVVDQFALQLEAKRVKVLVQIDPEGAIAELSDFNQKSEVKIDPKRIPPLISNQEKEDAINKLKKPWSLYLSYRATLTRLQSALSSQGMLERTSGQVKDSYARLKAQHEQLIRPIYRLLGPRARTMARGESVLRDGKIDLIRAERFQMKLKASARILLSFLLIPLIALFISRFIKSFGERIYQYVQREQLQKVVNSTERREREDRANTLFQVFRAASNLIILILTIIYLLKAIQVDVTPIIASAGILGLAFAFGAQELVKDFFAGFFILLENQYNIGDMVRINGTFGRIEKITLRLTIVRDHEGVVHFIPNGHINLVSNCTKEWSQALLEIGASYLNPPEQVIECLKRICDELCIDPIYGGTVIEAEVLGVERFDDSAVIYRIHIRVSAGDQWRVARIFRQRVMEVFEREEIEIPFPQMVLHRSVNDLTDKSGFDKG